MARTHDLNSLFAALSARHHGDFDAQQGQSPGGAVRAPGGRQQERRRHERAGQSHRALHHHAARVAHPAHLEQTLLPPAITMALYFVIFGSPSSAGASARCTASATSTKHRARPDRDERTSERLRQHLQLLLRRQFQRFVEEMLLSPPITELGDAHRLPSAAVCCGLMVGVIVLGVSLFFTTPAPRPSRSLSTFVLACGGVRPGRLRQRRVRQVRRHRHRADLRAHPAHLSRRRVLFGRPAARAWRTISHANPVLYMVSAFRYGILGVSDVGWA